MRPLIALVALVLVVSGCRKSVAPACRQICACSPCSGADLDACVEKAEAGQRHAESVGCIDEFETFVGCFEDSVGCADGLAATDRCTRVARDLEVCADAGSPFATVCDQAIAKIALCTDAPPGPPTACFGRIACQFACSLAADCDVIRGVKFDQAFNDCNNACFAVVDNPPKP